MAELKMLISPHADDAKVFLDKILTIRTEFPRLTTEGLRDGRKFGARVRVTDDFLEAVSVLVQNTAHLGVTANTNAITLRDSYGYAIAYEPVVQELLALAAIVAHTIRVQKAEAVAAALDVYAIATRVSKTKHGAELIPHVKDLRNKLHKKRVRKAAAAPEPLPVPSEPLKQ